MVKELSEYTPEELQEIGRKKVVADAKAREKDKENAKVRKQLWDLYKAGKIKL